MFCEMSGDFSLKLWLVRQWILLQEAVQSAAKKLVLSISTSVDFSKKLKRIFVGYNPFIHFMPGCILLIDCIIWSCCYILLGRSEMWFLGHTPPSWLSIILSYFCLYDSENGIELHSMRLNLTWLELCRIPTISSQVLNKTRIKKKKI